MVGQTAAFMAMTGMVAARLGARLTQQMQAGRLKVLQGWFQILVGPTVIIKAYFSKDERLKRRETIRLTGQKPPNPPLDWTRVAKLSCIGIGSGFAAGLFGIGESCPKRRASSTLFPPHPSFKCM